MQIVIGRAPVAGHRAIRLQHQPRRVGLAELAQVAARIAEREPAVVARRRRGQPAERARTRPRPSGPRCASRSGTDALRAPGRAGSDPRRPPGTRGPLRDRRRTRRRRERGAVARNDDTYRWPGRGRSAPTMQALDALAEEAEPCPSEQRNSPSARSSPMASARRVAAAASSALARAATSRDERSAQRDERAAGRSGRRRPARAPTAMSVVDPGRETLGLARAPFERSRARPAECRRARRDRARRAPDGRAQAVRVSAPRGLRFHEQARRAARGDRHVVGQRDVARLQHPAQPARREVVFDPLGEREQRAAGTRQRRRQARRDASPASRSASPFPRSASRMAARRRRSRPGRAARRTPGCGGRLLRFRLRGRRRGRSRPKAGGIRPKAQGHRPRGTGSSVRVGGSNRVEQRELTELRRARFVRTGAGDGATGAVPATASDSGAIRNASVIA